MAREVFLIQKWHVHGEFNNQQIANTVLPEKLEVYSRKEHVGIIEQSIKEIKERGQSTLQGLP